jgi:hypothetical protein
MTVDDLKGVAERAGVEVTGSGSGGNVLKDDVISALRAATDKAKERKD